MTLLRSLLAFVVLLSSTSTSSVVAGPTSSRGYSGTSIPLKRRSTKPDPHNADPNETIAWLLRQHDYVRARYSAPASSSSSDDNVKRANTATVSLTEQSIDQAYYGTVNVGTPPQQLSLMLDTGSSDLWVSSTTCTTCSTVNTLYDSSKSSTYKAQEREVSIIYGSGNVSGTIGTDTVTMAGFTIQAQTLGLMDVVTGGIVEGEISGIMGLGWQPLAQTDAKPWWLSLSQSGGWAEPVFGFNLQGPAGSQDLETPGGSMDIGTLNPSFKNINYISLSAKTYWLIPLQTITISGTQIHSGAGAAIDTGTSLIGSPPSSLAGLYSHIPNAQPGMGQLTNFYEFPCASAPSSVSLTFGGITYSMKQEDFAIPLGTGQCVGVFFALDLGSSSGVSWVVGDAFLRNVYTVFRANPAAVGFAALSSPSTPSPGSLSSRTASTTTFATPVPVGGNITATTSASISMSMSTSLTSTSSGPATSTVTVFQLPPTVPTGGSNSGPSGGTTTTKSAGSRSAALLGSSMLASLVLSIVALVSSI